MNKNNLRHWELRIGIIQVVVLTGLAMGAIVCAFFVGYVSGQNRGFETAMASNVTSVARLPIAEELAQPAAAAKGEAQIYARLSDPDRRSANETEAGDDHGAARAGAVAGAGEANAVPDLSFARLDESAEPGANAGDASHAAARKVDQAAKVVAAVEAASPVAAIDLDEALPGAANGVRLLGQPKPGQAAVGNTSSAKDNTKTLGSLLPPRDEAAKVGGEIIPDRAPTAAVDKPSASRPEELAAPAQAQARKAVEVQKEAVAAADRLPHGWFAQVAAPSKKSDADSLIRRLKSSGFSVVIENAKVRGQDYFRILVGPEDSRQQAEQLVSQLSRESYLEGVPFVRMVK